MEQRTWFSEQVKACEPAMYRLAMSILRDPDDAADAAQEAICRAFRGLDGLRERQLFRPWLLRILANTCYDMLRERRRYVELDSLPEPAAAPMEPGGSPLWQAVNDLNEDLRTVVVLYYYEGFSVKEIAAILKISQANAKTRLYRGRRRLRTMLTEELL